MDWDSIDYLECYFAVPMMGAVLHTVNVRLAPEQIVHDQYAGDDGNSGQCGVRADAGRIWNR